MSPLESVAIEPDLIRRLTRREYHTMGHAGLFADERVELLYGQLVVMSPIDAAHNEATVSLDDLLKAKLTGRAQYAFRRPLPHRTSPNRNQISS